MGTKWRWLVCLLPGRNGNSETDKDSMHPRPATNPKRDISNQIHALHICLYYTHYTSMRQADQCSD